MENDKNFFNRLLAFLGFIIPVFGWMIPMYCKPKNDIIQHLARQSFTLTSILIINAVVYYLISRLIPIQYRFVEVSIWLIIIGLYLILSIYFSFKALFGKKSDLSFLSKISKSIPL